MQMTSMNRPPHTLIVAMAAVVALGIATAGAPAHAAGSDQPTRVITALERMNLLSGDGTGDVAPETGVVVGSGDRAVSLKPETDVVGVPMEGGAAVVYGRTSDHYAYAVTGEGSAANAGYVVIHDQDAPEDYTFTITGGGEPANLETAEDGTVLVKDAGGAVLNALQAPWAIDASGRALPTSYTVDGAVVIQHVEHKGADYPVVADPRLACDVLWCTLELTRTETTIVAQGGGAAIGCAALGPAAPICAALLVGSAAMANIALANNKCIGVRSARALVPTSTHMVYIGCYA